MRSAPWVASLGALVGHGNDQIRDLETRRWMLPRWHRGNVQTSVGNASIWTLPGPDGAHGPLLSPIRGRQPSDPSPSARPRGGKSSSATPFYGEPKRPSLLDLPTRVALPARPPTGAWPRGAGVARPAVAIKRRRDGSVGFQRVATLDSAVRAAQWGQDVGAFAPTRVWGGEPRGARGARKRPDPRLGNAPMDVAAMAPRERPDVRRERFDLDVAGPRRRPRPLAVPDPGAPAGGWGRATSQTAGGLPAAPRRPPGPRRS
jgi:hypothetical protein